MHCFVTRTKWCFWGYSWRVVVGERQYERMSIAHSQAFQATYAMKWDSKSFFRESGIFLQTFSLPMCEWRPFFVAVYERRSFFSTCVSDGLFLHNVRHAISFKPNRKIEACPLISGIRGNLIKLWLLLWTNQYANVNMLYLNVNTYTNI